QTPEWKKAYIDYRALKKCIARVRLAQEGQAHAGLPTDGAYPASPIDSAPPVSPAGFHVAVSPLEPSQTACAPRFLPEEITEVTEEPGEVAEEPRGHIYLDVPQEDEGGRGEASYTSHASAHTSHASAHTSHASGPTARSHPTSHGASLMRRMTETMSRMPGMQRRGTGFSMHGAMRLLTTTPQPFTTAASYATLLTLLSPLEMGFFALLDNEREKIEKFYVAREKELQERTTLLREQLNELADHRELLDLRARSWVPPSLPPNLRSRIFSAKPSPNSTLSPTPTGYSSTPTGYANAPVEGFDNADIEKGFAKRNTHKRDHSASSTFWRLPGIVDPDDYQHAKRRLKQAVAEHYRALELLQNYRILNITGFRKALKKFQKVTKIVCSDLYMREKVDNSAFASDCKIKQMMTEMESLYASRFTDGDKKRATSRLRAATTQKTHHFSTLRTGIGIGVSLPPLALGIYFGAFKHAFADFWLGDQISSLVFSLSHIYVVPCIYVINFDEEWRERCMAESAEWPALFAIGTIPFFIRVIQSIKRYYDSGLTTHILNAGKYSLGIVMYLLYFRWRHTDEWSGGFYFAYIAVALMYSVFACGWDLLMDWSILRANATTFLLRDELLYTHHIHLYYVAVFYNIFCRFAWVIYVPETGPDFLLRSFIVGGLEITRRWVWNFYRLENEHIGNVDQYRATREIPLPYWLDEDVDKEEARDM
ncbi:EXS family-domain-containing protein, partial [Schizophyllum amplum]